MSLHIVWGDVPAWAAVAMSATALVISRRGQRANNEAAGRSATAAELMLSDQRQAAIESRQHVADAERPRPQFILQRGTGDSYLLRNVGTATATGVTVGRGNLPPETGETPVGIALGPQESAKMIMLGSLARPLPNELSVTWDGQDDAVALPMPS